MRRLSLALIGLLLLLAAPLAYGAERLVGAVGYDTLELQVRDSIRSGNAQDLREEIDRRGVRDGTVTAVEVQAYEDDSHFETSSRAAASCFQSFDFLRIAGKAPNSLDEIWLHVEGAEGSTSSTAALTVTAFYVLGYPAEAPDPSVVLDYSSISDLESSLFCAVSITNAYAFWSSIYRDVEISSHDAFELKARDGHTISANTILPTSIQGLWDGQAIVADSDDDRDALRATPVQFTLLGGPLDEDEDLGAFVKTAAVIGAVGTSGALLGGAAFVSTEFGRYKAFKLLAMIPLFSRFEKDDVLVHNTREQLYQFIRNNPGPSFSDLRRALELSNGTLVHHLRILEMQEFIKPVRDGFRTRFYIRGPRIVPTTYLTRTQMAILESIQTHPGLTQKELAQLLGLPRESVFYHARKLETAGKLRAAKEGKWVRYFPQGGDAGPMPPQPAIFGSAP